MTPMRRTIYVEYRPLESIAGSGAQSAEWAELRRRWMGLVARRAAPEDRPAEFDELVAGLGNDDDEVAAILAHHEPPIPAVYCFRDIRTANYPVPADSRGD